MFTILLLSMNQLSSRDYTIRRQSLTLPLCQTIDCLSESFVFLLISYQSQLHGYTNFKPTNLSTDVRCKTLIQIFSYSLLQEVKKIIAVCCVSYYLQVKCQWVNHDRVFFISCSTTTQLFKIMCTEVQTSGQVFN